MATKKTTLASVAEKELAVEESALLQEKIRTKASKRLLSLDALRGFNMLFIIGLATAIIQFCNLHCADFNAFGAKTADTVSTLRKLWIGPAPDVIIRQMNHVSWNGVRHHDTIFPLFLFLAGVSFPFSLNKQIANGRSTQRICWKVFLRGLALFVAGVIYSNGVSFDFSKMRYMGVLQHIGLAWMLAAFIYMPLRERRGVLLGISAFILVGYWLVLALVPAPDSAPQEAFTFSSFQRRAGELFKTQPTKLFEENPLPEIGSENYPEPGSVAFNYLPEGNFACYLDRKFVPGRLYLEPKGDDYKRSELKRGDYAAIRIARDPEGLFSTFPAIVTALLGMLCGGVLRRENSSLSPYKKLSILGVGGLALLSLGYLWQFVFPINKALWNSTFVCFVGGYSALMLALFYWLFDVVKIRWLAFPFAVVGMNSITIYLARRIVDFSNMRDFFFSDAIERFIPNSYKTIIDGQETVVNVAGFQNVATTCAGLLISWLFLYWLYKRKLFFKL